LNPKKIVITGGPSTGKTSVIQSLEESGFICMHEVIRSMTSEEKEQIGVESMAVNPIVSVADPLEFNTRLLQGRIDQFKASEKIATEVVFFDRGIPDVLAYMDCFDQPYGGAFEKACEAYRYDMLLLMPPWSEIHVVDGERFENFEETQRIHQCLKKTYERYGYRAHIVPKGSITERTNHIIQQLNLG